MPAVPHALAHAIAKFGYGAVGIAVAAESMGLPFPGETALVSAAIYAGATHRLNIVVLVAVAAGAAVLGDNIGFWIGRTFGFRLLLHYGRYVRITERRIKLGQHLFRRHGGKVVFFGRFVAILRALAAFLAGANRMEWGRFLVFNVAGAVVWSGAYGFGAYRLGSAADKLLGPVGIAIAVAAVVVLAALAFLLHRNEQRLEDEAERALPGPVGDPAHGHRQQRPPPPSPSGRGPG